MFYKLLHRKKAEQIKFHFDHRLLVCYLSIACKGYFTDQLHIFCTN